MIREGDLYESVLDIIYWGDFRFIVDYRRFDNFIGWGFVWKIVDFELSLSLMDWCDDLELFCFYMSR